METFGVFSPLSGSLILFVSRAARRSGQPLPGSPDYLARSKRAELACACSGGI